MKKWHDINKKNLAIAVIVTVVGFLFALMMSIMITGDNIMAHIVRTLALWPFLAGLALIWGALNRGKHK